MTETPTDAIPHSPTLDDLTATVRQIASLAAEVTDRAEPEPGQPITDNRRAVIERQRVELLAVTISEIRSLASDAERAMAELLLLQRGLTLNQTAQLTRFSAASLSNIRARPKYFTSELPDES